VVDGERREQDGRHHKGRPRPARGAARGASQDVERGEGRLRYRARRCRVRAPHAPAPPRPRAGPAGEIDWARAGPGRVPKGGRTGPKRPQIAPVKGTQSRQKADLSLRVTDLRFINQFFLMVSTPAPILDVDQSNIPREAKNNRLLTRDQTGRRARSARRPPPPPPPPPRGARCSSHKLAFTHVRVKPANGNSYLLHQPERPELPNAEWPYRNPIGRRGHGLANGLPDVSHAGARLGLPAANALVYLWSNVRLGRRHPPSRLVKTASSGSFGFQGAGSHLIGSMQHFWLSIGGCGGRQWGWKA